MVYFQSKRNGASWNIRTDIEKKITDEEKAGTPEILKETRSAEDDSGQQICRRRIQSWKRNMVLLELLI